MSIYGDKDRRFDKNQIPFVDDDGYAYDDYAQMLAYRFMNYGEAIPRMWVKNVCDYLSKTDAAKLKAELSQILEQERLSYISRNQPSQPDLAY
jgi:hypothetical protein